MIFSISANNLNVQRLLTPLRVQNLELGRVLFYKSGCLNSFKGVGLICTGTGLRLCVPSSKHGQLQGKRSCDIFAFVFL